MASFRDTAPDERSVPGSHHTTILSEWKRSERCHLDKPKASHANRIPRRRRSYGPVLSVGADSVEGDAARPFRVRPGRTCSALEAEVHEWGPSMSGQGNVPQRLVGMRSLVADQPHMLGVAQPDLVSSDRD